MLTARTLLPLVLLAPLGLACPSSEKPADTAPAEGSPADGAVAQADAGQPAAEGAPDTGPDSGPDTGPDSGPDSGPGSATGAAAATGTGGSTGSTTGAEAVSATGPAVPPTSETGEAAADAEGGAESGETGEPVDPKEALLAEAATTKTKDDRAMEALVAAKEAEATPRELAEIATKRAKRLFRYPDRAKRFFEYAMTADESYADAPFHLAKLAATTGDIIATKEHLVEVKKRGGKKLLSTVEFDPTFALVADDPDVRKLWQ